ncbi:unnamed protein product [Rhizoctonia solani]|uniref:Uncharacterized protein n=1 Tax=Rhizoctonia solani TaxID=456999 RepID=A0A8H3C840_9AGAM|nr:unnamed protein product [Rhizoctonia solani]
MPSNSTRSTRVRPEIMSLLRLLDAFLFFGLGAAYVQRFAQFERVKGNEKLEFEWRHRQQREWDRLGTTLGLLATMMAAILALSPEPPGLAAALWLSGSVVAVSGIFITNYLSVKAFDISDDEMRTLVQGEFSKAQLVPIAIACPPVAVRWASLLFVVGIFDYTIEYPFKHHSYLVIALVPMTLGVLGVCAIVFLGETLTKDMGRRRKSACSAAA